jgi:hypothetical protein
MHAYGLQKVVLAADFAYRPESAALDLQRTFLTWGNNEPMAMQAGSWIGAWIICTRSTARMAICWAIITVKELITTPTTKVGR